MQPGKLKLAKHPCRAKVKEAGQELTCFDMWRVVTMRGKQRVVVCFSHGHHTRGKSAEVYR